MLGRSLPVSGRMRVKSWHFANWPAARTAGLRTDDRQDVGIDGGHKKDFQTDLQQIADGEECGVVDSKSRRSRRLTKTKSSVVLPHYLPRSLSRAVLSVLSHRCSPARDFQADLLQRFPSFVRPTRLPFVPSVIPADVAASPNRVFNRNSPSRPDSQHRTVSTRRLR